MAAFRRGALFLPNKPTTPAPNEDYGQNWRALENWQKIKWFDLPLAAFTAFTVANAAPNPQFTLNGFGNVTCRGLGKSAGAIAVPTVIGTLPEECRPVFNAYFICMANIGAADIARAVYVTTAGQIIYQPTGAETVVYVSLDGISFYVREDGV